MYEEQNKKSDDEETHTLLSSVWWRPLCAITYMFWDSFLLLWYGAANTRHILARIARRTNRHYICVANRIDENHCGGIHVM